MKIKSQFVSTCRKCGTAIAKEELIEYRRGEGGYHLRCVAVEKKEKRERTLIECEQVAIALGYMTYGETLQTDTLSKQDIPRLDQNTAVSGLYDDPTEDSDGSSAYGEARAEQQSFGFQSGPALHATPPKRRDGTR